MKYIISCLSSIFIVIVLPFSSHSQYSCSTAHIVSSLPFSASDLSTIETGFAFSGICSSDYDEQDYVFQYVPTAEGQVNIEIVTESSTDIAGIYVFDNCGFVPTNCIAYEESSDGTVDVSFQVDEIKDFYIFIGTENFDNFDITITRTPIVGIAINKSEPTQALDVNGSIRISEGTTTPYAGTIRWNQGTKDFEGYNGTEWIALTNQPEPTAPPTFGYSNKNGSALITAGDPDLDFGFSVAIDDSLAVVGAPGYLNYGQIQIFKKSGENWFLESILFSSDNQIGMKFGNSVAIAGSIVIVGAPLYDQGGNFNQGRVFVFRRAIGLAGPYWFEQTIIENPDAPTNNSFGWSVSIDGSLMTVGVNTSNVGKALVYRAAGASWFLEATLEPTVPETNSFFGHAVSISGDKAIVSAPKASNGGKAYLFLRSGNLLTGFIWTQEAEIIPAGAVANQEFGSSVDIDGNYVVVGSMRYDNGPNNGQGCAYVFRRQFVFPNGPFLWTETSKLIASDGKGSDFFGISVSISGDYIVAGASYHDTNENSNQGKAYIYKRSGDEWMQDCVLTNYSNTLSDRFGHSVSISGGDIIIGAYAKQMNGFMSVGQAYMF